MRLDDDANNLSLNGISESDEIAFKDDITGALIDPASQRVELQGESSQTITWNLDKDEFGLYAAVMITEENEIITIPAKSIGILTPSPSTFKETYLDYKYVFSVEDLAIGDGLGTTETITLSKNSYNDVFSYTSDDGANGNGKTLARSCYNCADWAEANSTPGIL